MASIFCGIDFHKNTSTIYATDGQGKQVEKTTVRTCMLRQYLRNRKDWQIGIEATGGSNHIVDQLKEDGHEVLLINPNQFRGIAINGVKTDDRDSIALATALRVGFVPLVHHKSLSSRRLKSLLTSRELFVRSRVSMMNHVRGTLREYGITMPAGAEAFYENAQAKIMSLDYIPIRDSLLTMYKQLRESQKHEKEIEQQLAMIMKDDQRVERLQTIPGVGPMSAYALIAVTDDIKRFESASQFASFLGLVPSITASADKIMMGNITRSGPEMTRRYLIHGARAWMRYSPGGDPNRAWAEKLKQRRGMNKAVVALAHRIARIAFAVMRDQTTYGQKIKKAEQLSLGITEANIVAA